MRTLAADECIHTPCLSFSWKTSDDELIMPYVLSHGLRLLSWLHIFPIYLVCLCIGAEF